MNSFQDVIDAWPSQYRMAKDLAVSRVLVNKWRANDNIPARYWKELMAVAEQREIEGISAELLADLASRKGAA